MTMADQVAVMNAGKVEQMGPPEELYDLPRTAFVANFLGQSNLLPGEVVGERDEALEVSLPGGGRALLPRSRAAATSGRVVVGVRPEKVHLVPQGADGSGDVRDTDGDEGLGDAVNDLGTGRVVDVAFAGVSTQYVVDVPGAGRLSVFAQNLGSSVRVRRGDRVRLACAPAHVFGLAGDVDLSAGLGTSEPADERAAVSPSPADADENVGVG